MRYLLLIPASIAMLGAVMFWTLAVRYRWPHRWQTVACVVAGMTFQFSGIWIAGYLDR